MKFEIKHRATESILFSAETESLKLAVELAVRQKCNLAGAKLAGAKLAGAKLAGANLTGADLTGAYLTRADLTGANLTRAYLTGADLTGANLTGADLTLANLTGANLTGATGINPSRYTPLLMLLDQPGKIRAYKLVTAKNAGPFNGGIVYEVGKPYAVKNADTNPNEHCAAGISLATLDWCMMNWKEGFKILIAEFTAKDIAAIPTATDGKFRVHRCKIVGEKNLKQIGLIK